MEIDHQKIEGMVPKWFHRWLKVFGKVELERMPVWKVWDHAIDVKEDFKPSKAKVYPLSRNKREEVQKFVDKHLKKGYIRPSKSQQTSPVFFVGKKNRGKCMVMDYRKLNKQTVNVMETLDSTELLMEDQAWLDYLWDFETREINLDLSSDTD